MFDKTIKLKGEYPSDFKPTMSVMEIQKNFSAFGFHDARIISGHKWDYQTEHEEDLIIFNANVLMPGYSKVWFGDLNLTEDYLVLKDIAESLDTTLYVLWEMDARFGEETKPLKELLDKAVWDTTEGKPTNVWYRKKMKDKNRG